MCRILLIIEQKENRRLLSEWLETRYEVFSPDSDDELPSLQESFDLCIICARTLDRYSYWLEATKKAQEPVFLPFLLVTSRRDVGMVTRHLWQSIHELIVTPIEKVELHARVEMLLQRRKLSLELKQANDNLQQINEIKTRFLSIASHEIRNPLHTISAYAQILQRSSDKLPEEKKQEFYEKIKVYVKKITDILDDILLLSRGESGKQRINPIPINLNEFCEQVIQETQLLNKNIINFFCEDKYINACIDEKVLRHILINLLTNAIKYSPKDSPIDLELISNESEVIFQIKDKGIGITPEDQQHLFESFYRASNVGNIPGTGLGLAIVKQCVDLHGGKIAVKSEVGVGTTFTVTLPIGNTQKKLHAQMNV
ncbi:hybrid sensor histidine kinase/response regulator [Hassallia byssoidea VB512170]|uniref:histidine kinase n=1 Tax=Hassallia byssoidea VB512170 TaxID=1304833 RepID=A0A846HF19_9CYAN|nr:hybrid sensor histidine kinase/response regulator [Hassalia byssoidea]NEU75558.1 hybrid sensor histidine kinase/response regulator [Hassalia byssoidea VB512170]